MKRRAFYLLLLGAVAAHGLDLGVAWNDETGQSIIAVVDDSGWLHRRYGGDPELEGVGRSEPDASGERRELLRWDPAGGYHFPGKRWSWTRGMEPCPGEGPYELLVRHDQSTGSWDVSVLDGAGQLYAVTRVGWNPKGGTVPGPPPYRLTSVKDPKIAGFFPLVLDGEGRLWSFI